MYIRFPEITIIILIKSSYIMLKRMDLFQINSNCYIHATYMYVKYCSWIVIYCFCINLLVWLTITLLLSKLLVSFLRIITLYCTTESQPYYGESTWDEANDYCKRQNDTLVKIHDLRKLKQLEPLIWSSLRGKFTPWIAYRGTFSNKVHTLWISTLKNTLKMRSLLLLILLDLSLFSLLLDEIISTNTIYSPAKWLKQYNAPNIWLIN